MPTVHVSGFPKDVQLLKSFRSYIDGARLTSKYWVTEVADIPKTNLTELTIDFKAFNGAIKAEEYMNNVPYISRKGREYRLSAKFIDPPNNDGFDHRNENHGYQEERHDSHRSNERYGSHDRDRSRSPIQDPAKLDFELELLRKKRLLVEEERKLLLEQKKLELIKEYGPNAIAEFNAVAPKEFGEGTSNLLNVSVSSEFERDQEARDKLLRPVWKEEDPADRHLSLPPEKRPLAHIPQFVLPCRIILKQMKKAIARNAPDLHERNVLKKMISSNLRRRFAIILENKPYTPTDALTRLYRQVYPSSTDPELIHKIVQDVRACHWPKREKSEKTLERIAIRKAAKEKAKEFVLEMYRHNKPGSKKKRVKPSKKNKIVIDAEPDPQGTEVKPDVSVKTEETNAGVKTEVNVPVKAELNTSVNVLGTGDEGWATNGVDWDEVPNSKDA